MKHQFRYRSPLEWSVDHATPLPEGSIVSVVFKEGLVLDLRHQGDHLEINACSWRGARRLTVEPRAGNVLRVRMEPDA